MPSPDQLGSAAAWVGLDLGTSSVKAVALDAAGAVTARATEPYPTRRPSPQAAEQDPAHWLRACTVVLARLGETVPPSAWRGIGLSAMIPTLVVLDEHREPLGPAITWEDARAEAQGERLREALGGEWLYERTGQWVDGRYLLAMFARLAGDEPRLALRARHLIAAKDLLFQWLTGDLLTDPSTASGFGSYDVRGHRWLEEPLAVLGRELSASPPELPAVEPSLTTRPLSAVAARSLGLHAGLPVCLGAADSVLGAFGLGAESAGQTAYISGTSNVVLALCDEWAPDAHHRYLLTPLAHDAGGFALEMDLLATGSAIAWLTALLAGDGDAAQVMAQAADSDPALAPLFLPYLAPGEQGALWNPELRGTLAGLHLGHRPADLVRGLLNGIVLESRRCLDVLAEAGLARGELHVAGWSAEAPGFCRDLADACRRTVRAAGPDARDCSATGAALLLAQALGDSPRRPSNGAAYAPDTSRALAWDALWDRHERAREAATVFYEAREALCMEK